MAFNVSYVGGGELDKLKRNDLTDIVNEVKKVHWVDGIKGFPTFTQPYNTMIMIEVPALEGIYETTWNSPDEPVEILAFTVTCSGYGEKDNYNIICNDKILFDHWYCSEVKEGLFLGTSTFVYQIRPNSVIKLQFNNESATQKYVWLGIRMLVDSNTEETEYTE